MFTVQDHYHNAHHYDIEYADVVHDVDFHVGLAKALAPGGNVLELCAGTGRITLPLARAGATAGFSVVGLDITPGMLEIARQKLHKEPPAIREAIQLVQGDMRTVDVGKSGYNLILIPFNSFLHMTTPKDQHAALCNVWAHLAPGGHFMADIFVPDVRRLARNMGPDWIEQEKVVFSEEHGIVLIRSGTFGYQAHNQLLTATWLYQEFETIGSGKLLNTYWSPFEIRVIFPGEWPLLLERAGFDIVEKWGSFAKDPFGKDSKRMLFLCQKTT